MASVTCTRSDVFPNGTVIKAYPRVGFHSAQQGAPSAASVAEATMSSGTCTFEGLGAGQEYTLYAEVGGKDATLAVQAPANTAVVAATGLPEPSLQKLLGYSFDPAVASGTFQLGVAGTLYLARIPLKEQVKISNILLWLATKGATLTAAQCFAGLFAEGTRQKVAQASAAETIAKFEGTNASLVSIPLEAAVVAGPGYITFGTFYNGTTAPTLAASPASAAALVNAGVSTTGSRFATGDTGLTTALPSPVTASMVAAASPIWVGLS
ncbi:MAG TPA: hypothetical protein VGN13_05505 [Solirubrobacteraceae bacterium]|jgi:hypothetical protein